MSRTPTMAVDVDRVRARFPALASGTVFLENAGGAQVPGVVADAIRDYMLTSYVQLGAGYPESDAGDRVVRSAHTMLEHFVNGQDQGRVMIGPSCTRLVGMLADAYGQGLRPGDEIVVMESGHEANVGPWLRLSERGVNVRLWNVDPATMSCPIEALPALLTGRTKLVVVLHVSNLLGGINDVKTITRMAHDAGARVVVDGVAYAPHRAIDVRDWDVDWYVWSAYKVYGPHVAAMYGRSDAIAELRHPNHFFIAEDDVPYAFEPGGVSHEACAGLLALGGYLRFLAGAPESRLELPLVRDQEPVPHEIVSDAFTAMTALELPLQQRLVDWLGTRDDYRIIGPAHGGTERVGTISVVHDRWSSREIATRAHSRGVAIRHGHMYAHRLCTALGIPPEDGVVRLSLIHYNTMEEIERAIEALAG